MLFHITDMEAETQRRKVTQYWSSSLLTPRLLILPLSLRRMQSVHDPLLSYDSFLHKFPRSLPDLTLPLCMSGEWMKDCHIGERQQQLSWTQLFSGSYHGQPLFPSSLCSLLAADSDPGRFLCSRSPWQTPQVRGKFPTPHSWQKEVFRISHHPSVSQLAHYSWSQKAR